MADEYLSDADYADLTSYDPGYYGATPNDFGAYFNTDQYSFDPSGLQFQSPETDFLSSLYGSTGLGDYMAQFAAPSPAQMADFSQSQLSPIEEAMYNMSSVAAPEDLMSAQTAASALGVDPASVTPLGDGRYEVGGKILTDAELQLASQQKTQQQGVQNLTGLPPEIASILGVRPAMSAANTRLNDILSRDQGGYSTVDATGAPIAVRGQYSTPYDFENDPSGEKAVAFLEAQVAPGTGAVDQRGIGQKLLQAGLNALRPGTSSTAKTYRRNADGSITETPAQESSLLAKALQAYGILAGGGGTPPAAIGDKSAQAWTLGRKAGSGRQGALSQVGAK